MDVVRASGDAHICMCASVN